MGSQNQPLKVSSNGGPSLSPRNREILWAFIVTTWAQGSQKGDILMIQNIFLLTSYSASQSKHFCFVHGWGFDVNHLPCKTPQMALSKSLIQKTVSNQEFHVMTPTNRFSNCSAQNMKSTQEPFFHLTHCLKRSFCPEPIYHDHFSSHGHCSMS